MKPVFPTVSVIIPNYNHAPYLVQRIESVLNQTYQNFELILMDDCSSDNSLEILKKYENYPQVTQLLLNEQNSGNPFRQWKKGVDHAKGNYIWIAESDDFARPDFIEKLLPLLQSDTSIALAYAQSQDVDQSGTVLAGRLKWTANFSPNIWMDTFVIQGNEFINKYLLNKNVIPNASAVIFRKEVFNERFDPVVTSMKMVGDWLLWVSIIADHQVAFLHHTLNNFREHVASTRTHDTRAKKMNRLVEEAMMLNKAKKLMIANDAILKKRYLNLYKKWFKLFPTCRSVITAEFFAISEYIPVSRLNLLLRWFKYSFKGASTNKS